MPHKDPEQRRAWEKAYLARPDVKARMKAYNARLVSGDKYREYDRKRAQSAERKAWLKDYRAKPERIEATRAIEARREQKPSRAEYKKSYAKSEAQKVSHRKTMGWYSKTERGKAYTSSKSNRHRARKLGAHGSHTSDEWFALKKAFADRCAYCGQVKKVERDHAIPLAKGGANHIGNILPSCRSCNGRKGIMTAAAFMGAQDHG